MSDDDCVQASANETADEVDFDYSGSDDDVDTFEEEDQNRNPDGGEDIGGNDAQTQPSWLSGICYYLCLFALIVHINGGVSQAVVLQMVHFLFVCLNALSQIFRLRIVQVALSKLPRSWDGLLSYVGFRKTDFCIMVVCPKCSVYDMEHAFHRTTRGSVKSASCCHVRFPNHRQARMRAPCGEKLMKSVFTCKREVLRPRKVFALQSVTRALESLFKRRTFVNHFKSTYQNLAENDSTDDPEVFTDITDGKVWREFNAKGFFKSPLNLSLSLNIDWFRPFKRTNYSVGVLYFVINNLPRTVRYKEENVILAGVIPGPTEPKDINPFLQPIVDQLVPLFDGKIFFCQRLWKNLLPCSTHVRCS